MFKSLVALIGFASVEASTNNAGPYAMDGDDGMKLSVQERFAKNKAESEKIIKRYPERIPVICEKKKGSLIADIDKHKYLVPKDLLVGQFLYVIRRRIQLPADKAMFVFVGHTVAPTSQMMSHIYEQHKNEDGFLYMTYSGEETFGAGRIGDEMDDWEQYRLD